MNNLGKTITSNFILQNSISVALDTALETIRRPVSSYKHPNSIYSCQFETWFNIANEVSYCVDHLLYDEKRGMYYDHCYYLGYQKNGEMHSFLTFLISKFSATFSGNIFLK